MKTTENELANPEQSQGRLHGVVRARKAIFAITVSEPELDMMKEESESLASSDDPKIAALGERMCKAVKRCAKKMGFKYAL